MVEREKVDDLKKSGANHFLQKPFEIEDLIGQVCKLLDIEVT